MEKNLLDVIRKSKQGNKEALLYIINKFIPLIKKYARILNYEEAETDLIISLIEIIQHMKSSKFNKGNDGMIISYIHNCMKNKRIDLYRKYVKNSIAEVEINLDILEGKNYNFEDSLLIEDMLNNVTDLQRKILISKYIYGYSEVVISKKSGISRQAVNRAKNRAVKCIREKFEIIA